MLAPARRSVSRMAERLRPAVAVVDQGTARVHHAGVQGLLKRVERQVGAKRARHRPPTMRRVSASMTNATSTTPAQVATYVRSASHRAFGRGAWNTRLTRSSRARARRHGRRRVHPPAPHHTTQAKLAHPPRHRATGHRDALATERAPHLAHSLHPEALLPPPSDACAQWRVVTHTCRQPAAISFPAPCPCGPSTRPSAALCRAARPRIARGARR